MSINATASVFAPVARQRVSPGRSYWEGGLVRHRGHPFAVTCGHKHHSRADAKECADMMLHCDGGSLLEEELLRYMGKST